MWRPLRLGGQLLVASADAEWRAAADDPIWVEFDQEHLHLFDATTEQALPAADAIGAAPIAPREAATVG